MGPSDRHSDLHATKRALGALLTALLALGGLVACNQILGTDKYSDGEDVPGDASALDGTATDGNTDTDTGSRDSGSDVQVIVLPPGAQPATWAHWRMPDNVLGSVDAGPLQSYSKVDGSVVDTVTKLTWSSTLPSVDSFEAARDSCKSLGSTWRLPTRIELVSILDDSIPDSPATPKINAIFDAKNGAYWTASPVRPLTKPLVFWKVNFRATVNTSSVPLPFDNLGSGGYVRCVLGS